MASQTHRPIPGVLFDLDETLIDRSGSIRQYADDFYTEFQSLLDFQRADFVATLIRLDGNGYVPRPEFFNALAGAIANPRLACKQIQTHFLDTIWQQPLLVDGAIEGLRQLRGRGIPIGVVTNGGERNQQRKLTNSGLAELLNTWIISESFGMKKPDPAIFLAAARQLGIEPKQSWFVGDHPVLDITGADACGFKTIWLERSVAWPESLQRVCCQGPCTLQQAFGILRQALTTNVDVS